MNILIVDDSNDDRRMLCTVLKANGHEVMEAVNGREGLQAASDHRLDLIVSDVLMPVMDGFQFLRNLRKTSSVPFVFYSAVYDGNRDMQLAASLGANGYLIKPMDPLELLEKIERIAAQGGQEQSFSGEEEAEYLKRYSQVVAAKLEEKVRELELDIIRRKKAEEEREELREQLIQAQKMDSIGRLAGGVAHDFNNMLGVVLGYTEMSLEQISPDNPLFANLIEIRNATERSAELTRQLLTFARKQYVAPTLFDLNKNVANMLAMLRHLIGENIEISWLPVAGEANVKMDPSQMDQILTNLCVNARDAIAGNGTVTIETQIVTIDGLSCIGHLWHVPGEYVMLAVSDDGCGMNKEILDKIFEPFFTTRETGKGIGLGLATVYGIVKQNSGFIDVRSEPGCGTTFKIYLPRQMAGVEPTVTERPSHSVVAGCETILLVEDEPALLTMASLVLKKIGFRVLAASSPVEAIRLANDHVGEIQMLLTDVIMPGMNGVDLAKELNALYPEIKQLFMSGYTGDVVVRQDMPDENINFIQKPFALNDLAARIREVLDGVSQGQGAGGKIPA
ncbi:MAG: response regulator [Desulfuromonadaceae bacterium]|nr:response regulator [Desulfuromonadaceae bacterium]MDD5106428.1 response regulator [Desulfuromonadaceae bacterium]